MTDAQCFFDLNLKILDEVTLLVTTPRLDAVPLVESVMLGLSIIMMAMSAVL